MEDQSPAEQVNSMILWGLQRGIQVAVDFHNLYRWTIRNEVTKINQSLDTTMTDVERNDLQWTKDYYTTELDSHLRISTFFIMYTHAEEYFLLVKQMYAPDVSLMERSGSLGRFKPVLQLGLGIDLSQDSNWLFLCDAQEVRDCLLHANGRVSFMKKPQDIEQIVRSRKNLLGITNDRLYITVEFVTRFKNAVVALMEATTAKVKKERT